jgi:ElaB/YqjD/DUF883 family membrane-anchored ribosome-binding protein
MTTKAEELSSASGRSDEATPTTEHVASMAHGAIDSAAKKAEQVEDTLRAQAEKVGEKIDASREAVSEEFSKTVERLEAFVRKQPVTTAGIAFVAGIFVSGLLRR